MKKYFLLGLIVAIAPSICFGASASYTQLVREKQRKMAELEKCMGSSKGLKIAGLSTIGLTAVGVAGNIAEAQKLQEYDDAIAKKNKDIETKEKAIADEKEKIAKKQQEKSNPTPAPINENQQQCINRVNGEFTVGIPSKYQDSYTGLKEELDDLLEEVVDEDGGIIWHGHKFTCKKGTKFKDCDGVDDFLQGVFKAAVTDKECGTHLFNEIEEAKFLDSTDVAVDTFTENCKNSGGISAVPGTCYCLYGTANFMGQCPSLSTGPVSNKNSSNSNNNSDGNSNGNNNIEYNAEDKCDMTLGDWDDQYNTCFCPGLSIWDDSEGCIESEYEEIDLSDVSITSSNINNNNDLSTDESGTPASGQGNGSATKPTTNVPQETKKFKCEDSGGKWIGDKCQCMNGFNVDYEGKCFRLLDGIGITAPRKSDDNNPKMLKN